VKRLTFKVEQGPDLRPELVSVPFEDVERLMGDLAVFGDDEAMQRSRVIARALLTAMETIPPATVELTDEERIDVHVALTRVGQRGGLSQQLIDLRIACAPR
jgi:Fe-S-cluster formation regulator IscX/YfhJ